MHLIEDYYSNSCACDRYNDIYDLCFSSPLKVQIKVNQHSKRRKTIHSKPKKKLKLEFSLECISQIHTFWDQFTKQKKRDDLVILFKPLLFLTFI